MRKMIAKNWETIEEVEKAAREQIGDPLAGFNANLSFLGAKQRHLVLSIKYRKQKDGTYTDKYYDLQISAKYCPFSGKPLYEEISESSGA